MREKLIELQKESLRNCDPGTTCLNCRYREQADCCERITADYMVANGVTIQKWIPVTKRLPEDDLPKNSKAKQIKVLVAYMRNGNWVVRSNLRKKGRWWGEPDRWDWSVPDPITHWMPLPQPPKEG